MSIWGTRVLKRHVEALVEALDEARAVSRLTGGDDEQVARVLAAAMLASEETTTKYVVVTTNAKGVWNAYGPYGTKAAARKAAASGWLNTDKTARVGVVLPVSPAPKIRKADVALPVGGTEEDSE